MPLKSFFKKIKHTVTQAQHDARNKEPRKRVSPPPRTKPTMVEFSIANVAKATFVVALVVLLAFVVYEIREIILLFFIALLFAAALDPTVDRLQARKVPRWLGVILIYIFVLVVLGVFISNLIPLIASQLIDLAGKVQVLLGGLNGEGIQLPRFLAWVEPYFQDFFSEVNQDVLVQQLQNSLATIGDTLRGAAGNVFQALIAISNGVFNFLLILVLTFFMVVDERGIDQFVLSLFPSRYADYISDKSSAIKEKVGHWLRAQIFLGLVIGVMAYIGFLILGVEFGATLAIFAGIMEVVPYVGPFLAWVAAVPIVLNQAPILVLWVTVMFLIIQRLENDILVPLIMKQATGLSPILVLFAMLVGFEFMGVVGLILSIPVASTVSIFVHDYTSRAK